MSLLLLALTLLLLVAGATVLVYARRRPAASGTTPTLQLDADVPRQAQTIVDEARTTALRLRTEMQEELSERQTALDSEAKLLDERERELRDSNHHFNQHRYSLKQRRTELEVEQEALGTRRQEMTQIVLSRAEMDRESAAARILERIEGELAAEHPDRVDAQFRYRVSSAPDVRARTLITEALQRQDQGHADSAPRMAPIPLEELDEPARQDLISKLEVIAVQTGTELGVDLERAVATLRGQDPLRREVARQAVFEVVERKLEAAQVPTLILNRLDGLRKHVAEIGSRAMWEMRLEGRPELAELMGTLHYRFSYGQNALLHCQEAGYLCGVLAAELGLEQSQAREAGTLHDIGKAVDHDVEGSHAIIGGELLQILGKEAGIVHAVKAHHFDEEPSTDLAMLTICADAISASRPGARRDTLATYLARLEQLQTIATRHEGVERAYPLQAGREVRIVVKAKQMNDDSIGPLSHEIAREIEAEMQYPGLIKVTVIRETAATATAPAQINSTVPASSVANGSTTSAGNGDAPRRRRRGGRNRKPAQ